MTNTYEDWWDVYDEPRVIPAPQFVRATPEPAEPTSSCACGNPTCVRTSATIRTPHGKCSRYTHHNCRCDLCVAAYRESRVRYRVERGEVCGCGNAACTRRTRRKVRHGLSCYYRHKCRCDICVTAVRDYQREYRERRRAESAPAPAPLTLMEVFAEMDSLIHIAIG